MTRVGIILLSVLLLATPARAAWTSASAAALVQAIDQSRQEGLNPQDYQLAALKAALDSGHAEQIEAAATQAFMALARDYAHGRTPPSGRIRWNIHAPALAPEWLAARMAEAQQSGAIADTLADLLPRHPQYLGLRAALAATAPDDQALQDLLRVNLDRWRWMPRDLGDRHLLVNVPAFEATLVQDGTAVSKHRVIVGAKKTPTPQFSSVATGIVLNPPWVVPNSIVRESVGGLIARSPATARARGYTWTGSGSTLSVTQQPGPGNALGQVKIDMPNAYSVFLHDTPSKALFDRKVRALSHGCIRTEGIAKLADLLLPDWDAGRIAATFDTRVTTRVPLLPQLPVFIAYFTAAIGPEGQLVTYPDIYGRDGPVLAALGRAADIGMAQPSVTAETECQVAMPNRPA